MKRPESLIPLTHDHHHALAQARRLRMATGSNESRRIAAVEFLGFYEEALIEHFREEEETVFPLVVDEPEAREFLEQAMFEHLQLHSLVRDLKEEIAKGAPSPAIFIEIAARLEGHIRFEERVLFPLIETLSLSLQPE